MFAEPIYLKAYQRGVFAAAVQFCDLHSRGQRPPVAWPYTKSHARELVRDLASSNDEVGLRRLTAISYAGARNEWRHLGEALRHRSGIFLRPEAYVPESGSREVGSR